MGSKHVLPLSSQNILQIVPREVANTQHFPTRKNGSFVWFKLVEVTGPSSVFADFLQCHISVDALSVQLVQSLLTMTLGRKSPISKWGKLNVIDKNET